MPPRGSTYLVTFGTHGMVAHQNRWLSRAGECADAQNVTFENDLAQQEPASGEYDPIGIAIEAPNGTATNVAEWGAAAVWLPATLGQTPAFVANVASVVATTAGRPWIIPIATNVAVGATLVIAVGQTLADPETPIVSSLTDTSGGPYGTGNTYVRLETAASELYAGGVELWIGRITKALVSGVSTLVMTFTEGLSLDRTCAVASFSGCELVPDFTGWTGAGYSAQFGVNPRRAGYSYPALIVAAAGIAIEQTTIPTWLEEYTERVRAAPLVVGPRGLLTLASKVIQARPTIVAQIDWQSDVNGALVGTVSTTTGSATVTGSGTEFLVALSPGDRILAGGEEQIVDAVASDTSLTTVEAWTTTQAGSPATYRIGPRVVTATLEGGSLLRDVPTTGAAGNLDGVLLKSGLTTSRRRGRFVPGGKEIAANPRKLFYFNGADRVQVLTGHNLSATNIATTRPLDWDTASNPLKQPINGLVHRDRLWGFGNLNDPHRLYYSTAGNQEDFQGSGSGSLRIASQIGERLYCAASFRGKLILWKYPRGIFYVVDDATDYTAWFYVTHSEGLGCAPSPHAVLSIDDDLVFLDPHAHLHLFSAVDTLGGVRDSDLTRQLGLHGWVRDTIDTDALEQVVSVWDPQTKTALFGCRSRTATGVDNDLLLRFDFGLVTRGGPVRFSYSRAYTPNALCLKRRNFTGIPAVMVGERANAMFVDPYAYGYQVRFGQTVGLGHTLRTPPLDLADQNPAARGRRKLWHALELILTDAALTTQSLTITIRIDGVIRDVMVVQSTERRRLFQLEVGDGYEIDLTFTGDSSSPADVGLLGCIIYYGLAGVDQSRVA